MGIARKRFQWSWPYFAAVWLLAARVALADHPIDVWFDVDTATGIGDVDDGLMLIQGFHSPELHVRGVSVVFGNAPLAKAVPIATMIVERFGPAGLRVLAGATGADQFGKTNAAVEGMAAEIAKRPLTIVAVGPVTNVGTLVKLHPELHDQIERIVMVAARRPGQKFVTSTLQEAPHRDFNFELDPAAMQAILDTEIPLVFAPWEVSSQVWISQADLETLRQTGGSGAWIAESSQYWINRWEQSIDTRGFNPFDTLAVGWLTHPRSIESEDVVVAIEQAPDDRTPPSAEPVQKPYLVARPAEKSGRKAVYCARPTPAFKQSLMQRLSGR